MGENMKNNYAFYCYGIDGVEQFNNGFECEQNPSLLTLKYGCGKKYVFHADQAFKLIKAVYGVEMLLEMKLTEKRFNENVEKDGLIECLNVYLKGRGMVMVTDFKNYLEYFNGGQNAVVGITSIDLNGAYHSLEDNGMFTDQATYEEMYEYTGDVKE